mmetsp:Transcript_17096/g.16972  ORF Transcript_17096/g.16972 Transcript_17096/m.16972 type:complete len:315 (+) Transcript_17096:124-1068(+)
MAIGIKSWQPLAIASAKQEDGSYNFSKGTMVLMCEITKLLISTPIFLYSYYTTTDPSKRFAMRNLSFQDSLRYMIPAILYGASNTLVYFGLSYINPALFHVLGNIRIITAGILYRIIMKQKQTDLQWVALMFLTIGAILASPDASKSDLLGESSNALLGLFFITTMCLISTSSSIYTELYFKKGQDISIWFQNLVLYMYGIFVNGLYLLFTEHESLNTNGFFYGWDWSAIHVLVAQSLMGVILSFVFKYLGNIVYVISLTISMVITAVFSIIFFEFQCTLTFICAVMVVTGAIYLYYRMKILDHYKIDERNFSF